MDDFRPARWPRIMHPTFGRALLLVSAVVVALVAGCATFPQAQPSFTVQPSLTAPQANPTDPDPPVLPGSSTAPANPSSATSASTGPTAPADPCKPTDPAVIAACLKAPWGLVVLPGGASALVGERTTGIIWTVAPKKDPAKFATVPGIVSANGAGLLGLALSPSYPEDGLVFGFVATATDSRIVRFAKGEKPKVIFSGIPHGASHLGGQIDFGADGLLYVATGDGGSTTAAADPKSLAGKILRLDAYGKPAQDNPARSAVFARGLTDPSGLCPLPDGTIGALDHRRTDDVLLSVEPGRNFSKLAAGQAVWTWTHADGGAADCAAASGQLANTSLAKKNLTGVTMSAQGTFSGSPEVLLDDKYGRLLTVTVGSTGTEQLFWMTTSNRDGHGQPVPADDRVIVLPAGGGGGGNNGPD